MKFNPHCRISNTEKKSDLVAMSDDEVNVIYFALRTYRDSLAKSLQEHFYANLAEDDYREEDLHLVSLNRNNNPVPDVHMSAMIGQNISYENTMFLYEQLYQVEAALFELVENHDVAGKHTVQMTMGLD